MASFRINKVILIESNFSLRPDIEPGDGGEFRLGVGMTRRETIDEIMIISLDIKLTAFGKDQAELLEMSVKMDGMFELDDDLPGPSEDYLANVNAPAIIYPFIREHIATTTAKAGIDSILIPPFNFVEHYQKMQEQLTGQKDENEAIK